MQKLLSDSVYTTGLHPASSSPLLIPWRTLQPELLLVLQVAFAAGVDFEAGSVYLAIWKVVKQVILVYWRGASEHSDWPPLVLTLPDLVVITIINECIKKDISINICC